VTSLLPLADVEPTPENEPFWVALREDRIDLPFCNRCRSFVWYPRAICPLCHQGNLRWLTLPGTGRIYSFTVVAKGTGRWKDSGPYVVAYVQLDSGLDGVDGPRILTNIVGDDVVRNATIDTPVRLTIEHDVKDDPKIGSVDRCLLRFSLIADAKEK